MRSLDRAAGLLASLLLSLLVIFYISLAVSLILEIEPSSLLAVPRDRRMVFAILQTLTTATISTLLAVIFAVPSAYLLSRSRRPFMRVIDTILDIPIVVSPVAVGALLLIFFRTPAGGIVDSILGGVVFTPRGLVMAQFTIVTALAVRLLKAAFDEVDPRFARVARVLGAGRAEAFLKVTLRLARPGLLAAVILTWARAVGEFGASVTLAGASMMRTETLPIAVSLALSTADLERALLLVLSSIFIAFTALLAVRFVA